VSVLISRAMPITCPSPSPTVTAIK
jgi:hypothetical protein